MRSCAGCGRSDDAAAMVRLVLTEGTEGPELVPDLAGKSFGRGAWVHARQLCLGRAASRGLSRSFRQALSLDETRLTTLVRDAASRRVLGLLASARGAGELVAGSDEVGRAVQAGRSALVIVALDARSAARSSGALAAAGRGQAAFWGTKAELGAVVGREETGIVAVTAPRLAEALMRAIALCQLPLPSPGDSSRNTDTRLEV